MHLVLVTPFKSFEINFFVISNFVLSICVFMNQVKYNVIKSIPRHKNESTGGSINQAFVIAL